MSFCSAVVPKLIALGTADTFCSAKHLEKKVSQCDDETSKLLDINIYPQADHFWSRMTYLDKMKQDVLSWTRTQNFT